MMSCSKRDSTIDIAKALGILLVVFGHALETAFVRGDTFTSIVFYPWKFIYSFHMPLFFILSGMVFTYSTKREIYKATALLVMIAIIVHVIGWFLSITIHPIQFNMRQLIIPILTLADFSTVVIWFLVAIALVKLIYYIYFKSTLLIKIYIIIILTAAYALNQINEWRYFQIGSILPGFLFYYVGHLIAVRKLLYKVPIDRMKILVLFGLILMCFLVPLNQGCNINSESLCSNYYGRFGVMMVKGKLGLLPLFFLTAIIGCVIVLYISAILESSDFYLKTWLTMLGKKTMPLIIFNGIALVFVQPYITQLIFTTPNFFSMIFFATLFTAFQILLLPVFEQMTKPIVYSSQYIVDHFIKYDIRNSVNNPN